MKLVNYFKILVRLRGLGLLAIHCSAAAEINVWIEGSLYWTLFGLPLLVPSCTFGTFSQFLLQFKDQIY